MGDTRLMPDDRKRQWLKTTIGVDVPIHPQAPAPAAAGAMQPDCEIVRGKVPGPKHHVLCATHGHILDEKAATIIAADLEEYKRKFPAPPRPHPAPAHHAPPTQTPPTASGPAPTPATAPPATPATPANTPPAGEMPPLATIPVPKLAGDDKAGLVREMSALDTLKPAPDNPDQYLVMLDGKETRVAKSGADAVRAQAEKSLASAIRFVGGTADNAMETYASQEKNNKEQWAVAAAVKLVQKVKTLGAFEDPGDKVKPLVAAARKELGEASAALGAHKFGLAAALVGDAEGKATQALQMVRAWVDGVISGAGTSVTMLQHTRTASFAVVAGLAAVGTGGAAGAVAAAVLPTASDVAGKAIAGEEINWSAAVIDLAMSLLLSKFGGAAEKAVAAQVEAIVAKKLAGRMAEETVKKIAAKVAETAGKQLISKGSELLKLVLNTVIDQYKGKKVTWDELMKAVLAALNNPEAKEAEKIQGLTEKILAATLPKT